MMLTLKACKSLRWRLHSYPSGFTLLELLVTLSITAMLSLIATPFIGSSLDKMKTRQSAIEISNVLKLARQEAIHQSSEIVVVFDLEAGSYQLNIPVNLGLPDEASITLTTASTEQLGPKMGSIRFFEDGSSTGGQIEILYRAKTYLVTVNWLNGQISLE